MCYGWGEGDDQLWGSGRRVMAGGANFCFISSSYIQGHQFHPDTQENNNEFCLELLADVTLFSILITQKLVLAISGLCSYNCFQEVHTFRANMSALQTHECFLVQSFFKVLQLHQFDLECSPKPCRRTSTLEDQCFSASQNEGP